MGRMRRKKVQSPMHSPWNKEEIDAWGMREDVARAWNRAGRRKTVREACEKYRYVGR